MVLFFGCLYKLRTEGRRVSVVVVGPSGTWITTFVKQLLDGAWERIRYARDRAVVRCGGAGALRGRG